MSHPSTGELVWQWSTMLGLHVILNDLGKLRKDANFTRARIEAQVARIGELHEL